jgi:hypothetical protein
MPVAVAAPGNWVVKSSAWVECCRPRETADADASRFVSLASLSPVLTPMQFAIGTHKHARLG